MRGVAFYLSRPATQASTGPMNRVLNQLTNLFPLWVTLCGVLALFQPEWFTWFK